MVAVINNFGGFYHIWLYVNEAKILGANIELPCVNKSKHKTSIYGKDVFLGFIHIKSLEKKAVNQLLQERKKNGKFKSLMDFGSRVSIGIEQFKILVRIGALRFTGKTKSVLLWEAHLYFNKEKPSEYKAQELFHQVAKTFELPQLKQLNIEDAYDEIEYLGFPISMSRIELLQTVYRGNVQAADLTKYIGKRVRMVGDLVTIKNVHTVNRNWMHFGCFIDERGKFFDTVNFPNISKQYPFTGYGVYLIEGKVVQEFDFPSIEVEKMARLPFKPDPRFEDIRMHNRPKGHKRY